jgi:hypothetical protein
LGIGRGSGLVHLNQNIGVKKMGKHMIRKYVEDRKNASPYGDAYTRAEAQLGMQLECYFSAWASLSRECTTKTDWNNFAKHVLEQVEDIDQIIKGVK